MNQSRRNKTGKWVACIIGLLLVAYLAYVEIVKWSEAKFAENMALEESNKRWVALVDKAKLLPLGRSADHASLWDEAKNGDTIRLQSGVYRFRVSDNSNTLGFDLFLSRDGSATFSSVGFWEQFVVSGSYAISGGALRFDFPDQQRWVSGEWKPGRFIVTKGDERGFTISSGECCSYRFELDPKSAR
ncbi:MAG: hypothetical protein EAZ24_01605 [Burkholderiales bacterium]|nr:MAG: hypothetical protein EAZ21_04935 [Betaproteobacteria bacterium]TAG84265.1 MAG: hypothetical protein EAZ24_01605 [Burkholderiales bacterium]